MRDLVISIFGEYQPIVQSIVDPSNPDSVVDKVIEGISGVDFTYLSGVVIFCITLYMVLSIVRSVIYRV